MEGMPRKAGPGSPEEIKENPELGEKMLMGFAGGDLKRLFNDGMVWDEKKQGPLENYKRDFQDFVDEFNRSHGQISSSGTLSEPLYTKTYETPWGDKYNANYYNGGFVQVSPQ